MRPERPLRSGDLEQRPGRRRRKGPLRSGAIEQRPATMRPERPLRSGAIEQRPATMRPERPLRSGAIEPSGQCRELGAIGMTIDSRPKRETKPWTTFTKTSDIPDWISKAYIESYRGPHSDDPDATETTSVDPARAAALVTPAML